MTTLVDGAPARFMSIRNSAIGVTSVAAFITVYTLVSTSGAFPKQVLVPPQNILAAFRELWATGELQLHLLTSLRLLAVGFGAGAFVGLVLGFGMGLSSVIEAMFTPSFNLIRQVPSVAFIPILILLLGIDGTFKAFVVGKAAFFPVALAAYDAVRGVSRAHLEVAAIYRLPLHVLLTRVVFPATAPGIVTGLRLGLGRSWGILVAAELYASQAGAGQMMEFGRQMFRIDVVMVGVVVIGTIGFTMDRVFQLLERRLARWRTA